MKSKKRYWVIVGLLLMATSLSFLDRQVLSVSILKINEELALTDIEYGFINAGFLISYAIMFTLGGILIDRYGSKLGLAVSVGFWSLATLLHSLANNAYHFGFFRFLLGIGEGGCFPGAIKAVMEWVPKSKHALANGIAIGGSALGAVVAPPLCVWLLGITGWRAVFVITGSFGVIWVIFWLLATKVQNSGVTNLSIPTNFSLAKPKKVIFIRLLGTKEVMVFVAIRFLLDPIFYFYMFWTPKYLNETHSLSIDSIGKTLWIPFLALGIANILGGWLSDKAYSLTASKNFARKLLMGFAALLTLPVAFVNCFHSPTLIFALMSLAFFAHGLWITNYITSIGDIFGTGNSSTVVGLSGSAGALSSLIINPFIGYVIVKYSYAPLWWYCGLMYPIAFVLFILFLPKIKTLELSERVT